MKTEERNKLLDEVINNIEEIVIRSCHDHTPYWGPCSTCGRYDYEEEPLNIDDIKEVIEEMKNKK